MADYVPFGGGNVRLPANWICHQGSRQILLQHKIGALLLCKACHPSTSCSLIWERRKFGALNRSARKGRWTRTPLHPQFLPLLDQHDDFTCRLVEEHVQHPGEKPV